MRCSDCGRDGLTQNELNWEVVGYERKRQQGGTNALAARRQTGRAICDPCLAKRKAGLHPEQESLV